MKNIDSRNHVRGKSIYIDDIPDQRGTLFAKVFDAPVAHAKIKRLDLEEALKVPGVIKILTYKDIPGENQIGGIIPDEPLLATQEIHFWGQALALVLAESEEIAAAAAKKIILETEALEVTTDPRVAKEKGKLIQAPRSFELGNSNEVFDHCHYIFEGQADSGGQEHIYLETQASYAFPLESGNLKIISSTQGPSLVQKIAAQVLGIPMNRIEVEVIRLGGGFGGKEDQATAWACLAALGAFILEKPVKLVLHRMDDMRMTGKRHPYSSDYKIGLDKALNIVAYEADYYQNAGAAADLSPAILERTLFHATSSYFIPNVRVTAYSCHTNLPPNTAFRGFGGPQAMFVLEAAITRAAAELGIPTSRIQEKNLLKNGSEFPYGQIAENCEAQSCWNGAKETYKLEDIREEIKLFNQEHTNIKKGLALMPICFGISFTNTQMNNARALVHVYQDGSVGVSTGAVEMGQGVNTKMVQVAAQTFGITAGRIKIETTNTTRVANASPTAASSTADLNGKALQIACNQILKRLKKLAADLLKEKNPDAIQLKGEWVFIHGTRTELEWEKLIQEAFMQRVNLSAKGHYSREGIWFDKSKEKGHPFAYHVYGTAIFEVTLDCIRGTYEFDAVKLVHDFGASMNRKIDLGQMEGGLVQGIGWMTMEELSYNQEGRLLSNALSTYKIPDIYGIPKEIEVQFLNTDGVEEAIFRSKAVGEPPFLYGIGAFFALWNAIKAFNPELKAENLSAPMTPEKALLLLYPEKV